MMKSATLTIPGVPIPKARPRAFQRGKRTMMYDSQKAEANSYKLQVRHQWVGKPLDCGVALYLTFYMPIAKSKASKFIKHYQENDCYPPHLIKPDLDNLIKWAMDGMNGIVYTDDKVVTTGFAHKEYGAQPGTIIVVDWVE